MTVQASGLDCKDRTGQKSPLSGCVRVYNTSHVRVRAKLTAKKIRVELSRSAALFSH